MLGFCLETLYFLPVSACGFYVPRWMQIYRPNLAQKSRPPPPVRPHKGHRTTWKLFKPQKHVSIPQRLQPMLKKWKDHRHYEESKPSGPEGHNRSKNVHSATVSQTQQPRALVHLSRAWPQPKSRLPKGEFGACCKAFARRSETPASM